jgi:hypothetical protein
VHVGEGGLPWAAQEADDQARETKSGSQSVSFFTALRTPV